LALGCDEEVDGIGDGGVGVGGDNGDSADNIDSGVDDHV
jgi:hypothetical protein